MNERLQGELPPFYVFKPDDMTEALHIAINNKGMYEKVVIMLSEKEKIGSFYLKCYIDNNQHYLLFSEFDDVNLFDSCYQGYINQAEVIEGSIGFKIKF